MIKMRKNIKGNISCDSCKKRIDDGVMLYDIYIGNGSDEHITSLCDGCMHELLTKLISMGKKK